MGEGHFNFRIQQEVRDGAGRVVFAMRQSFYEKLLAYAGVARAADLPEDLVRKLCCHAAEADADPVNTVETTSVLIHEDEHGRRAEFHSKDLGVDMVRRLMPIGQEEFALRCNPQYHPVAFELHVLAEAGQHATTGPAEPIGYCVLSTTLHPPSA